MERLWWLKIRLKLKIRLFFSKFSRKKKEDYNKGKIYPLW